MNTKPSANEIATWLTRTLGELLEMSPSEIDASAPFDRYGLDSSAAISVTEMLGDYLGRELDPRLLYDYPSIHSLVQHLVGGARS